MRGMRRTGMSKSFGMKKSGGLRKSGSPYVRRTKTGTGHKLQIVKRYK